MSWTDTARAEHRRRSKRYSSDLTDWEWARIEPHLLGPRKMELRDVMYALMYMAQTGCQGALLPKDFPPPSTV